MANDASSTATTKARILIARFLAQRAFTRLAMAPQVLGRGAQAAARGIATLSQQDQNSSVDV
jgi:hypothetical protein